MQSFKILSKRKLDLGLLVGRYRDVGNAYLRGPKLTIDNHNGVWFCIDTTAIEAPFENYKSEELARLRAVIGAPFVAKLESDNLPTINLAIGRFPFDGIFIENEHRIIFTVKEIQRRLRTGEDW